MGFREFKNFVLDVDGVLTTGHMGYTANGKLFKVFGPHDREGLKMIAPYFERVHFITADKSGFNITKARIIDDWGYHPDVLNLVSEQERFQYIEQEYGFDSTVYMADGYSDAEILKSAALGIAPANARIEARTSADYVTPSKSAEGAVMDACIYIRNLMK